MPARERAVRIVLQARMSSSRLPGKVLLDLAGMPTCVLAAARAATRGREVVVATSDQPADDAIVDACRRGGVRTVRGPLADTLERFRIATADLGDDDVVVRLTADNVVPDGDLVESAVEAFDASGGRYWHASHLSMDAPYGVSVEVFPVSALRRAAVEAHSTYDREHVTPWIRRGIRVEASEPVSDAYGRSTIDNIDDYEVAARIFGDLSDPVHEPWADLAARFTAATGAAQAPRAGGGRESALVLGTAQLGMPYGIANLTGMPDSRSAEDLLRRAVAHGVTHVDTAAAYGVSESRIGAFLGRGYRDRLAVMTKVEPLDGVGALRDRVRASVFRSIARLGADPDAPPTSSSLDTVLLHRETDAGRDGGSAWDALRSFRDVGLIRRIGVSVQTPVEAVRALALPDVGVLQLPFNLLDGRWTEVAARCAESDVVVVARSVFLQGLLSGGVPSERWPQIDGFDAARTLALLDDLVAQAGVEDLAALALAFVRGQSWIDRVVIGCETPEQLTDVVRRLGAPALSSGAAEEIERMIGALPDELVDPSRWPRALAEENP
jgi:aryl-alcohol dehydrogenase-like predicted oxidoreductase/spore coat polysaccharide biosynthesis protein SpsF (cytidylyltransferase family)